ncbi:MAG TPA: hypothetical protein PK813_13405, partial [Candidatus Hydrogenedens sp.]|nr:hypothetical protein [Candidatus Hydrogenedens sp.]
PPLISVSSVVNFFPKFTCIGSIPAPLKEVFHHTTQSDYSINPPYWCKSSSVILLAINPLNVSLHTRYLPYSL